MRTEFNIFRCRLNKSLQILGRHANNTQTATPIKPIDMDRLRHCGLIAVLGVATWGAAMEANAAILNDSSERQIRRIAASVPSGELDELSSQPNSQLAQKTRLPQTQKALPISYAAPDNDLADDMAEYVFGAKEITGDTMQGLIQQKQREFANTHGAPLSIEERTRVRSEGSKTTYGTDYSTGIDISTMDFKSWLNANPYRAEQVANYQRYLTSQVGAYNVPPMDQLLTTARSWAECGYEPYQLPPQYLWQNMVPTLKLFGALKQQGALPAGAQIRSVYRSPDLNECAGGAGGSKHMSNGAMDIWVPEYESDLWRIQTMQDSLCEFWLYQGMSYDFGLGIYPTGSIHIDTQGYRKWGSRHTHSSSPCRF